MKRIVIITCFTILCLFTWTEKVQAQELTPPLCRSKTFYENDFRVKKLHKFLLSVKSPLATYAPTFVQKADEYGVPDWKLVPAISGVESTFGKQMPLNSCNAYGWANGAYIFKSCEEGIDIVTKALKLKYIDRGLDTPQKISPVYAPPSTTWGWKVEYFMQQIDAHKVYETQDLTLTF